MLNSQHHTHQAVKPSLMQASFPFVRLLQPCLKSTLPTLKAVSQKKEGFIF